MNKLSTIALVVILSGTVAACDTTGPNQEATKHIGQRDVYNTLEDCVSPWLEIWYTQDETDEDWEERVTVAFRLDQENQKEYKKNQDDKDFKEYARLKAKFEGK